MVAGATLDFSLLAAYLQELCFWAQLTGPIPQYSSRPSASAARFSTTFPIGRKNQPTLRTYLHATELFNEEHPWRADSPAEETRILQGTGSVRLQTIAARRRVLEVDCSVPCMTQVHLLYYPGWQAHDLTGTGVTLQASPENGLIELALPSGYHRIQLELPRDSAERLGPWVSFLSFGMLLIVANPRAMGFSRFIARFQRNYALMPPRMT